MFWVRQPGRVPWWQRLALFKGRAQGLFIEKVFDLLPLCIFLSPAFCFDGSCLVDTCGCCWILLPHIWWLQVTSLGLHVSASACLSLSFSLVQSVTLPQPLNLSFFDFLSFGGHFSADSLPWSYHEKSDMWKCFENNFHTNVKWYHCYQLWKCVTLPAVMQENKQKY